MLSTKNISRLAEWSVVAKFYLYGACDIKFVIFTEQQKNELFLAIIF